MITSSKQLLDEEDKLKMDLLGVDPTLQPQALAGTLPTVAPPPPAAPAPVAPPTAPTFSAKPPDITPTRAFTFDPKAGIGALPVGPTEPTDADKTSAAIYSAFAHKPMPGFVFDARGGGKGSQDPYAAFKADLMARKFDEQLKNDTFGQQLKTTQENEALRRNAVVESLAEKGAISKEALNLYRKMNGDRTYELAVQKEADAEDEKKQRQRRFGDEKLTQYYKAVAPDVPVVRTLEDIEKQAPGMTQGLVSGDPAETLSNWDKFLSTLPRGLGTQLMPAQKALLASKVKLLAQMFAHPQVGSNFTESEAQRMGEILNNAVGSTPEAQAAAIDMIRQLTKGKLSAAEAAFSDAVPEDLWKTYYDRGGVGSKMSIFSAPSAPFKNSAGASLQPQDIPGAVEQTADDVVHAAKPVVKKAVTAVKKAVGAKVKVSNGQETLMVDPGDVDAAKADGFEVVE